MSTLPLPLRRAAVRPRRGFNRAGFALEATLLVMVMISALILAALAGVFTAIQTTEVDRANTEALYVAEGGADAVMSQLSSFMSDGFLSDAELGLLQPPVIPGWTFDAISATKVGGASIRTITDGDYTGLVSYNQQIDLRVRAYDARNNRGDVLISANAQAIPVFQFGVFYDKDLEIHPGAPMFFEGWVHTNGNLFLNAGVGNLNFESLLTTPDSVIWNRKSDASQIGGGVRINNAAAVPQNLAFDQRSTTYAQFVANSQATFDARLRSIAHGVAPLRLPLPLGLPPHTMVEPRNAGDNSQTRDVKFAWKSDLVLRVNMGTMLVNHGNAAHFCNNIANGTGNINATWQRDSGAFNALPTAAECKGIFKWNPTGAATLCGGNCPAQLITRFRDGRENQTVDALDIDVAALRVWVNAAWATRKVKVLYVEFYNVPVGRYPALRMINGSRLPGAEPTSPGCVPASACGFTVSTHVPIYVKGDYNYLGASPTFWKPASLVGDAIIFLSAAWTDLLNGGAYGAAIHSLQNSGGFLAGGGYAGNSMYVYAAVAAGHSPTTCDWQTAGCSGIYPDNYGGGLENFPRFQENWGGGRTLVYRGSLVSLYFSQQAAIRTWAATPGYYGAPTRDWRFDLRFQQPDNLPPGTPLVGTVMQLAYRPVY